MGEEFQCEYCDKTFPEENALLQHQRAVHPETIDSSPESENYLKHWLIFGSLLLLLGGTMYYFRGPLSAWWNSGNYPTVNDHWHAPYQVTICGKNLPPFPRKEGDVHTHGNGRIHIHPYSKKAAGKNANMKAFMNSVGGTITDTRLVLPSRGTYENGDLCSGGEPGTVQVIVDGEMIDDPDGYVPRDGDEITIKFGPTGG